MTKKNSIPTGLIIAYLKGEIDFDKNGKLIKKEKSSNDKK